MTDHNEINDTPQPAWPLDWGRLLRIARQVAGLSLSELSQVTGLSKGHLSKLESGHPTAANPSRATLAALARALPSFRPLANTLEPSMAIGSLVFGVEAPTLPEPEDDGEIESRLNPVRLGWRELEVVLALLALEGSASPVALSALLLARAVGRRIAEIEPTLENLVAMGVLDAHIPALRGAQITYQKAATFEERTGIVRIGDALVLAAGLLAQTPVARHAPSLRSDENVRGA